MKKIVLSLAGALAATAFAPEAAAIPAFARQTGMACSACHQQHFPVLNSFGMAFKSSGYTMMGAQGKIEGEHLSIPDTLNGSLLTKLQYVKSSGNGVAADVVSGTTNAGGQWLLPDEFSLFFGGRAAENIGFLLEINLVGSNIAGSGITAAQFKMPIVFDMGGTKLSATPFVTGDGGMAYGYELSSNGMVKALRWSEEGTYTSAARFVGLSGKATTGLALVAKNDMGYINLTRFSPNFASGPQLRSNWLRIAATPTIADWNMHIGAGFASGSSYKNGTPAAVSCTGAKGAIPVCAVTAAQTAMTQVDTKASIIDFQGQTQLGGKDFSLYANYARAPGTAAGAAVANLFNAGANARTAFAIGGDYSVIPNTLHLGASYLTGDTGGVATANKAKGTMVQAIYDLQQNVALHAVYLHNSGNSFATGTATNTMRFMLEAAW